MPIGFRRRKVRHEPLGESRGEIIVGEVGAEAVGDARPQHLDRHLSDRVALAHRRLVDLGDGGGGDRRAEARIGLGERLTERLGDNLLGELLVEGRNLVLQALEVARDQRPDHVGTRRQELAELHIGGPEPGEGGGQPVGARSGLAALDDAGEAEGEARRRRQGLRVDEAENTLAGEDEAGPREAKEMDDACDHGVRSSSRRKGRRCRPSSA